MSDTTVSFTPRVNRVFDVATALFAACFVMALMLTPSNPVNLATVVSAVPVLFMIVLGRFSTVRVSVAIIGAFVGWLLSQILSL